MTPGATTDPAPADAAPDADRLDPTPTAWENPGGMWLPEQMPAQAMTLGALGFELAPSQLAGPTGYPLGAIVSLGGCSGSFVSAHGLVATNHHCVTDALAFNSTPARNLLRDGYVAASVEDERPAGPTARVYVTLALRDVSREVRSGIEAVTDDLARQKLIERRTRELVAACERGRPELRCTVHASFGFARFTLVEQLEIRDVRLVYAPPESIGNFGGEVDNWRWPRHAGDFAFLRAYVDPGGRPGGVSAENVPYSPPHALRMARSPLRPGAPVLVAGYPWSTSRLSTSVEARVAVEWELPYSIEFCEAFLAELTRLARRDDTIAIKAEPTIRGLSNWLTHARGQLEGMVQNGLVERKARQDEALESFVHSDPTLRRRYGGALSDVNRAFLASRAHREEDASLGELERMVRLFGAAETIVRNAEERPKPDAERQAGYQGRDQRRLEEATVRLSAAYSPTLDSALLRLVLRRELARPPTERAGITAAVLEVTSGARASTRQVEPKEQRIDDAVAALYARTRLGDQRVRIRLLKRASLAELRRSDDPMLALALRLRERLTAKRERHDRVEGAMALLRPRYVAAVRVHAGGLLAPDANGTLRVTYGVVRGFAPRAGARPWAPFTTLEQLVQKHSGRDPFSAPPALLAAAAAREVGPYSDPALGDVPVNFLADLDITGGNSGSATLNGRGELVGLAFDGNYESIASHWLYLPEVTRSIHVDLRYMLWVMDFVSGAPRLLRELGVEPASSAP